MSGLVAALAAAYSDSLAATVRPRLPGYERAGSGSAAYAAAAGQSRYSGFGEPGAGTFARSAPIVVSSPCPVLTTVSSGSENSTLLIDSRMTSQLEKLRPVAPGPPLKSVSPVK